MSTKSERDDIYAKLTKTVSLLPQDNLNTSIPATGCILSAAEALHSLEGDNESDSLLLCRTSTTVSGLTSNATNDVNPYDKDKFADHIRNHKDLWHFSFPYEVPVFSYLYGTVDNTQREPRLRPYKKTNRHVEGPVKAPAKLAKIKNKSEENPEAAIQLNNYLLKRHNGECSYFHLILDPTSFTRTVENIYNVSILIKDNKVVIYIDPDTGLPFLKCVKPEKNRQRTEKERFIQSIDMEHWSNMIEALRITKPLRQLEDDISDDEQS